jgi:hypothetical protein
MTGTRWILTPGGQRLAWITEQNWVMDAKTHQVIGYLNPDNNCVWPRAGGEYLWYLKGAWLYTRDHEQVGYIQGAAPAPQRRSDDDD